MYSTQVFYYVQRQIVVLLSGNSDRSYMPQYAKPLTLHKGVDNQIQFKFLNQEQKPVDITGKEITCRIIDYNGDKILLSKALTLQLPLNGIAALILNASDLEDIAAQKCSYSLEIPVGDFDYPVFVDQSAGARGVMDIVNSVLPSFVPSIPVSIPSQPFPNISNVANMDSPAMTYYSSVINTYDNPILTIQNSITGYYGNITLQGSTIADGDWYQIDKYEYVDGNTTVGYTINGYHPYIRIQYTSNVGNVTNILTR
jgi:hypothetical protein